MARTNNLTNFLNDVATAIKAKLGDNTPIPANQFDTKIGEIETVGTYQSKTINVTANGSQTITPDTGYDAISEITINTAVPQKQLQTKSYQFTQNATLQLTPDSGYDGFDQVNLAINVDTGDATDDGHLQAKYLLQGYSAVVSGVLIQGTMPDRGTVTITPTSSDIPIPEGHYNSLSIPIINPANCTDYAECSQALAAI